MINNIPFVKVEKKIQLRQCTTPQYVYSFKNPDDDTNEMATKIQDRILQLPEPTKEKLSSYITSEKIQQIGQSFNLQLLQMADISRAIRSYYFGELKLEDLPNYLAREIPIGPSKAQEISRMIIEKIINDTSVEQAAQAKLLQITITDSLKQIPEVGEQLITSEKIQLKNFPEPVRPSLKNWLADYDYTQYSKEHTAMERGIYLFQGTNGKKLSSQDRNKLAYILKAYDEKVPISVNKETKQIVFQSSSATITQDEKGNNFGIRSAEMHNNMRFSSPQKLPYEKTQAQPYTVKPVMPQTPPNIISLEEKPRPLPKNVVNLKDLQ